MVESEVLKEILGGHLVEREAAGPTAGPQSGGFRVPAMAVAVEFLLFASLALSLVF